MEYWGIGFAIHDCKRHRDLLEEKLRSLERKAFSIAKREFSLTSSMEIGVILFDEIGLAHPTGKRTSNATGRKTLGQKSTTKRVKKSGGPRWSTSKDVLKAIKDLHPLPAIILEHRKITGLITKYIDVLPKYVRFNLTLGMDRIHASWMQTSSPTGRLAVKNPNLQCIPHQVNRLSHQFSALLSLCDLIPSSGLIYSR